MNNYKLIEGKTYEEFSNFVNISQPIEDKVVYFSDKDYFVGVIFNKEDNSINFFYENTFDNILSYYIINPFIDNTTRLVDFKTIISNLYYCYFINFKMREIIYYDVFLQTKTAKLYNYNGTTCTESSIKLKKSPEYPNFTSQSLIKKNHYIVRIKAKFNKKLRTEKNEDIKPLIIRPFLQMT